MAEESGSEAHAAAVDVRNTDSFEALEAGEMIAKGIEREDFIIPVHPHVVKIAETRWQEIADSFAVHAPYTPESEKYNVLEVIKRLRTEND